MIRLSVIISNYKEILTTGSPLALSQILNSVISFLSAVLLGYLLPKDIFGEYKYLLSLFAILSYFSMSGYGTIIIREVANNNSGIYGAAFNKVLISSFFGSILAIIGALYYFTQGNTALCLGLLIISFFIPLNNSFNLYSSFLSGKQNFKAQSISQTSINFLCAMSLVIVSYVFPSPNLLLFTYYLVFVFGCYYVSKIYIKKDLLISSVSISEQNKESAWHLSVINVIGVLSQQIDKLITFHFLGPIQLAVLFFAEAIPLQIKNMQKVVFSVLIPKFASSKNKIESLKVQLVFLSIIMMIFILIFIEMAPYIYKYIFPKYLDSVRTSQVYAISLIFIPSIYLLNNYFTAKAHIKKLYITTIFSGLSSLVFNFYFISKYGTLGAAYSAIITNIAYLILLMILYKRHSSV